MRWFRLALVTAIAGVGCDRQGADANERPTTVQPRAVAAPAGHAARATGAPRARAPRRERPAASTWRTVDAGALCVTRGELAGARVEDPTFRAVAPDSSGDGAALRFVVHGATATTRALASGQDRRQLGLKLRAGDGCNLVYVMWRLDPTPKIDVSFKQNPGERTAKECGARGYTKIKPVRMRGLEPVGTLDDGLEHELRAAIVDDTLSAWIDDRLVWRGRLPSPARDMAGPAGIRSDNLDFELVSFTVDGESGESGEHAASTRCERHASD